MERNVVMTGIGGQGVQLAGNLLAKAAVREGNYVSLLGVYGGEMRGGPSGQTIIVGDRPIETPPKLSSAWSIVEFHPRFWDQVAHQAKPGTLVLFNSDLALDEHLGAAYRPVPFAATGIAREVGGELLATMVLMGAYLRLTGMVQLASFSDSMQSVIPAYRHDRIAENVRALAAGYEAAAELEAA
jgi:2-oxoacid:acceptor oxidoreductase gamma subunit (pyruvate/2-ketoisovalerate family)